MLGKILTFVSVLALALASSPSRNAVVVFNEETNAFSVEDVAHNQSPEDEYPEWIAAMNFENTIMENGWSSMNLTTNTKYNDTLQMYAAGILEGHVTSGLISQAWTNTLKGYCDDKKELCKKISKFVTDNLQWMLSMSKKYPEDPFWHNVLLSLTQLQGMQNGYKGAFEPDIKIHLDPFGIYLFQLGGDLGDLEIALNDGKRVREHVLGSGSCSALIKLVNKGGKRDLFVAQDTWNLYESMLRIVKHYDFGSHSESFSSYPGYIFSGDDFYIHSSGLVTLETTNGNLNSDLWKYVTPQTVPDWARNIAANRLAKDGKEWCEIFSRYNSGTYNNQWMIVDYNKYENDEDGLLYVLEQLPGMIEYADVTDVLKKQSYWASYNVPYFPKIFNATGLPAMVKKYGDWFTHDKNPRARIFARDHENVVDVKSLRKLMRYNDFKHDPLSKCNCTPPYSAENTIAARSDLNPKDGVYPFPALGQRRHGATDVKMTSSSLRKSLALLAECGPTHDQQPVFQWSTSPFASKSHEGHPDKFDFGLEMFYWDK